jgi:hypothetical protein
MRARERKEVMEFFLMLLKVWQTRSHNDTTKTVRYETYFSQTAAWTVLCDVIINFLGKTHTHFHYIALSVVFVST